MNMTTHPLPANLSIAEEDALALASVALEISRTFSAKDEKRLAAALNQNLNIWVGIRTLVSYPDHPLPGAIRDNLIRLSDFVAQQTFQMRNGAEAEAIQTLVNTNLQISEGLLTGPWASPSP